MLPAPGPDPAPAPRSAHVVPAGRPGCETQLAACETRLCFSVARDGGRGGAQEAPPGTAGGGAERCRAENSCAASGHRTQLRAAENELISSAARQGLRPCRGHMQRGEAGKHVPCHRTPPAPAGDAASPHRPPPPDTVHGATIPSSFLFLMQQEPFNEYSQKWKTDCQLLMTFQLLLCTFNPKIGLIFLRLPMCSQSPRYF